jgi:hypothetical protein
MACVFGYILKTISNIIDDRAQQSKCQMQEQKGIDSFISRLKIPEELR